MIECPHCEFAFPSDVVETRAKIRFGTTTVRRRRRCKNCKKTYATVELPEELVEAMAGVDE